MAKIFKSHINFALLWSMLVLVGAIVGFSLSGLLTSNLDDRDYTTTLFFTLFLIGLFIGLGQWLAIGFKLKNGWAWITATAIGFSVGTFLCFFIVSMVARSLISPENRYGGVYQWAVQITAHMLTGMFTGALQWFYLRRKLTISFKWLLLCGVSLVSGYLVNVLITNMFSLSGIDFSIRFAVISSSVFALLTCVFAEPLIMRSETASA